MPGRLSVTRTFGDIEAKLTKFGGNPKVIIAVPDIKTFKITPDNEFIIHGSFIIIKNIYLIFIRRRHFR